MRTKSARKARTNLAAMLLVAAAFSCSDPHKVALPADIKSMADDKSFQASIQKLSPEERELFAGYVMRSTMAKAFTGVSDSAHTVGEAIASQRTFLANKAAKEAEEKALAEKVAAERAAALKTMNDVLTAAVTDKTFIPEDIEEHRFSNELAITVAFKNNGPKDLMGVKGTFIFNDIFGDKVSTVSLKVDDPIASGTTYVWHGSRRLNRFDRDDTKLANTPLDKLKVSWQPATYLFKDGTSLTAPDAP